jgi:hypothetical protein
MGALIQDLRHGPSVLRGILWHIGFFLSALTLSIIEEVNKDSADSKSHTVTNIFQVMLLVVQTALIAYQLVDFTQKGGVFSKEGAIAALNVSAIGCFVAINVSNLANMPVSTEAATFLTCAAAVLQLVYTRLEQIQRRESWLWNHLLSHSLYLEDKTDSFGWLEWAYDATVLAGTFLVVADRLAVASGTGSSYRTLIIVLLGVVTLVFVGVGTMFWAAVRSMAIIADLSRQKASRGQQDVAETESPQNSKSGTILPTLALSICP